jgi:DNA recombination protein RmuC
MIYFEGRRPEMTHRPDWGRDDTLKAKESRMLIPLLVLQIVTLLAVVYLLVRKQPSAEQEDSRLTQLPDQLTRLDARNQAADEHMRNAFAQMRTDIAAEAQRTREASAADFTALRTEITSSIATLGQNLKIDLNSFR